jgi:predicted hotdog family 3-hydroxylacyl-ACP dehydratase
MSLIHRIVEVEENRLAADIDIDESSPFFEAGTGVPAWIGLEYMAQAVAALAGARSKIVAQPVKLGLLVGCRRFHSHVPAFKPGSELRVTVWTLATDGAGVGAFSCVITDLGQDAKTLIEGQLTVFEPGTGGGA